MADNDQIADRRIWLAVSPQEKEEAVKAGGKDKNGRNNLQYHPEEKLWYVEAGTPLRNIRLWLPDTTAKATGSGDPRQEFADALREAGFDLGHALPKMDGKIHRAKTVEDRPGTSHKQGSGAYKGFLDRRPGGWFVNYQRSSEKEVTKWVATGGETDPMTRLHIRAAAKQASDDSERAIAEQYKVRTAKALSLYNSFQPATDDHPYLQKKGVRAEAGMRISDRNELVIPFYDHDKNFRTMQFIEPDGKKRLFTGAPKSGNFRYVGGEPENGLPVLYAEGYATAKSLHDASGLPVVMTIDAGNMRKIAEEFGKRFADSPHFFMSDLDHTKKDNKGLAMSVEAAERVPKGISVIPVFTEAEIKAEYSDFNDIQQSRGLEGLSHLVSASLASAQNWINKENNLMSTSADKDALSVTSARTQANDTPVHENTTSGRPAESGNAAPDAKEQTSPGTSPRRPGAAQERTDDILTLQAEGLKPAQIAEQLGIGQTSVYRILRANQDSSQVATEAAAIIPASTHAAAPAPSVQSASPAALPPEAAKGSTAAPDTTAAPAPSVQSASPAALPPETAKGSAAPPETTAAPAPSVQSASPAALAPEAAKGSTAAPDTTAAPAPSVQSASPAALPPETAKGSAAAPDTTAAPASPGQAEPTATTEPEAKSTNPAEKARKVENAASEEDAITWGPRAPGSGNTTADLSSRLIDTDALMQRVTWAEKNGSVLYSLDGVPAFRDHGNRMTMETADSSKNNEVVMAALLTAIKHYGGKIEITGSDEFKNKVVELIASHDLKVSMRNPMQQAMLDDARAKHQTHNASPENKDGINATPVTPADKPLQPHASTAPAQTPPPERQPAAPLQSSEVTTAASETTAPKIAPQPKAADFSEGVKGRLLEHGAAPYQFDDKNNPSYYVRLQTRAGEKEVWGKELEQAINKSRVSEGQVVSLKYEGRQPVTVNQPVYENNKVVRYEPVSTHRNSWTITPVVANNVRPPSAPTTGEVLSAYDMNAFRSIQERMLRQTRVDNVPAIPEARNGLLWVRPDGRGTPDAGDPVTAKIPPKDSQATTPVLTAQREDGQLLLHLVKGNGPYLQGVAYIDNSYHHVLASMPGPGKEGSPSLVLNAITPDGLKYAGLGQAINKAEGKPVARDSFKLRLGNDATVHIGRLEQPERLSPPKVRSPGGTSSQGTAGNRTPGVNRRTRP